MVKTQIMIIKDSITRVVVEAKLNVSENVNYAMKNDLAQLFLEAMYSDRQENNRQDKTLSALTDELHGTYYWLQ